MCFVFIGSSPRRDAQSCLLCLQPQNSSTLAAAILTTLPANYPHISLPCWSRGGQLLQQLNGDTDEPLARQVQRTPVRLQFPKEEFEWTDNTPDRCNPDVDADHQMVINLTTQVQTHFGTDSIHMSIRGAPPISWWKGSS